MNPKIYSFTLFFGVLLAAAVSSSETIYKWTDKNGVTHMTNIPPVEASGNVRIIDLKPPDLSETPEIQYSMPEEPGVSENVTAVDIIENHVIVPVLLSYKGRQVNARLLLDTGATTITLHKDVAAKLMVRKTGKGSLRVAGGEVIDAEAVVLDAVTVGPHTRKNLVSGIIKHRGPDVPFDGMLGMNFLKNYKYTIDFQNKTLRWND